MPFAVPAPPDDAPEDVLISLEPANEVSLPRSLTPFLGREREIASLLTLLESGRIRLVTLTGPGGAGKTRLSLAVADALVQSTGCAALFVPLAAITDPGMVLPAIAEALGLGDVGERSLFPRVASSLARRRQLLVLDNLEQVLDAASLVSDLLRATSNLLILVTSRAPLRIEGEQEFPVPPLAVPAGTRSSSPAELARSEAGGFFVQHARAVDPTFGLTDENVAAVAEICRLLGGLPLALELAAARIKVLSPKELRSRLDHQLQVLTGGPRDRPARQRTMREAIAWSYELLDEPHQRLFRRLAIFRGGFTIEFAEQVLASEPRGTLPDILDGVSLLADQSLLSREELEDGEGRFRMLETIREFGLEQLEAHGELERSFERLIELLQSRAEESLAVATHLETLNAVLDQLEPNLDNVRAALDWLEPRDPSRAMALTGSLFWFWYVRGHHAEGMQRLRRLLAGPREEAPAHVLARALMSAGIFSHFQDETEAAKPLLQEALATWRAIEDDWGTGFTLFVLGIIDEDGGEYDRALRHFEEAVALLVTTGDLGTAVSARYHLAVVAFGQRDLDGALAIVTSILDEAGSRPMRITAWAIHLRSLIRFTRGEVHEALADCQESLRRFRDAHYPGGITEALAAIAVIAGASDQIAAVRIWAAAERMDEARGASFQPPERDVYESAVSRLRAALGEEVFQSERATGRSWSAQEAIDAGLAVRLEAPKQDRPVLRPPAIALSVLSPRETEVLSYVAAGWTNDRIAEHLYLSPRTVHAHLTTIYRKLNVANRAAAVRLALESGISG